MPHGPTTQTPNQPYRPLVVYTASQPNVPFGKQQTLRLLSVALTVQIVDEMTRANEKVKQRMNRRRLYHKIPAIYNDSR